MIFATLTTPVVGCGSHILLGDEMGGAGSIGSTTGGAASDSGSLGALSTGANCAATCSTLAEPVYGYFTSIAEVYSALGGTWRICQGAGTALYGAPADAIGVEYDAASPQVTGHGTVAVGNMYYLVQGTNGPVRGQGFDYQLTYDVSALGTNSYQLDMHDTPASGFGGPIGYSPCPRQFTIGPYSGSSGIAIIVPF